MYKHLLILLFCAVWLSSCSFFESKLKKNPIMEVDTVVDFNTVDAFPLFPNCKDIPSREKQQICFQLEMSQYINAALMKFELNSVAHVNDTVLVRLRIDALGITSITKIQSSEETKKLVPELDSIVEISIDSLPVLMPAIKRNMPVATEFVLPIILKN